MPFGTCAWVNGQPQVDFNEIPKPELRQDTPKSFTLLRSFCYLVPNEDPARNTVIVIPGADAPTSTLPVLVPGLYGPIVVPPNNGGHTDLASVPPFMWWLVASYGNHTRAALLHDALIPDEGSAPPVERTAADRLLLQALREPGQQRRGAFRHWLMWAAVSVFGTMRAPFWLRPAGVVIQVYTAWIVLMIALILLLRGEVRFGNWWHVGLTVVGLTIVVLPIFLVLLGTSWRAGANVTAGWLPTLLLLLPVLVLMAIAWSGSGLDQGAAFWLFVVVGALLLLGHVWGLAVDPTLRWRLWPTAFVGLPIAGIPVLLIFLSIGLVWLVDVGASISAIASKEQGRRRGFHWPTFEPFRTRF
ncbi:MAG TPA: DUF1353 domain-containing protein [Gaiellaceae bacterium]|jgi:Protein of unknown function (DUF1353)